MYHFHFTNIAKKSLDNITPRDRERIVKKLSFLKHTQNINSFLKPLRNLLPATHRVRVGSYRLLVKQTDEENILVLKIGHRREIYK